MSEPGTLLGGRYELSSVIGRGGMAEVWRAHDRRLSREVAVKRLRIDLASDPTFQARFRREAQASAGLNHPNIVAVYDTGEEADSRSDVNIPYIVMELVEGHTLRDVLRDGRRILPERALEFAAGVLDALSYSHQAGIIHRDIKPANVMLTSTGQVKVMDFGIARAVADTAATMTQTAAVIGTAQYLSPEQARGETVDQRSDIYSAGCLLYELLVGRPPFIGDSPVSVAYQHVREIPVPPSQLDPEISAAMDAVTLKALAKDPADRYQNAREMREDIDRLIAGDVVAAAMAPTTVLPGDPVPTTAMPVAPGAAMAAGRTGGIPPTGGTGQQPAVSPYDPHGDGALEEQEPKKKRTWIWILSILGVILLGVIAYGVYQVTKGDPPPPPPSSTAPAMRLVPSLTGMNEQAAGSTLQNEGFKLGKVTKVNKDEATKGTVIDQSPKGATRAPVGSTVDITVNEGPKMVKIPDGLVGKTFVDAQAELAKVGLDATKETDSESTEKKDQVTSTSPEAGQEVQTGTKVVLRVASGKVQVPKFVDLSLSQAQGRAKAVGLELDPAEIDSDKPKGVVLSQNPSPDELVNPGTKISITVSKGPAPPTPPPPSPSATPSGSQTPSPSPTGSESPGG